MKPKASPLRALLFLIGSSALALSSSNAQLQWDANGTGAGQTNGGGAWLGTNLWWNGSANQNWVSGSDAVFGGPNTAGGAVTLASPTAVGSIAFNTFTGTYTLGSVGQALTINGGITNSSAAGVVSLTTSPIILGASQTWTNNSSGSMLARGGVNNAGHTLTIDGSGGTSFDTTTNLISGSGGLTKNGTGRLVLGSGGSVPAHSYTGTTTLNGGVTLVSNYNFGPGNLLLNGGVFESYWTTTFTRALGPGVGQIQITGGASGFGNNNGGNSVVLGGNSSNEVVWGAENEAGNLLATGFFNPSTLVLQTQYSQNANTLNFQNKIDLNGTTRTIQANSGLAGTSISTISGVIRNSAGTPAGLTKTGPGLLILTGANTYNGGTTISQGNLRFGAINTMPAAGDVAVQDGATLVIEAGAAGDWTSATSGNGTIGGLLSGLGGQTGGTVSYTGNVTLGLETTANLTYAGDIGNVGTSLSIAKSGGSSLTLSGSSSYGGVTTVLGGTLSFNSIGNVGGGNSALGAPASIANGTIDVGYRATAGTLIYTGTGHTSDRVINLAGTTGAVTLDASGSGAFSLTSAITATGAGAKTLALTGSNTAANSLASASIPGLAEILTIQKNGAGTWWINGFSSPRNAWSVTAGTLVAAGAITTGDQQVTVSGGTLAGIGPITLQSGKTLTVQAAGSLAPGNLTVGTLAVTGNLSVSAMAAGTGKLNFQIGAPAASDKITVTGTAQIGSDILGFNDFVFTDVGGITSGTYVLLSATGGITGTLDPANRIGMIGSINGTLQINGNNLEWSTDQDLDGIPDVYEFANTTPPSATDFNPGDDLDSDGSTNLQEYLAGTSPTNPDSDADGFKDGYETNTGTWASATNTGTNPLVFDTDGDTIRDGYEANTGIFVSISDPGTNPNLADTDGDGYADQVETHTGVFVSKTNTGTNPNNSDTDNDGAGDWYEITASLTSPFLAGEKPNVPYPLPDPDTSTGATNKPVKVYIMSGQSNMVGMGLVGGTGDGSLETMTLRQNKFPDLVNGSGAWTTRQDVHYRGVISDFAKVKLSPGTLGVKFGPELGFGYVMGWHRDEPVLLLKSSIGNRALGWDILPPGSTTYQADGFQFAAYGETPEKWTIGSPTTPWTTGSWYAGYEWDRFFTDESEWIHPHAAETNVVDVLDNFSMEYPAWAAQGFEIAGFVWWQGDRDRYTMGHATRYEENLVRLITSLRSYYENRYNNDLNGQGQPNNLTRTLVKAPFVLATLGQTILDDNSHPGEKAILDGMLAVDGESGKYSQFAGNVKTVYAHPLSEGGASNGHYNERAGTYLLVGDALGRAMVELESVTTTPDYDTWATKYPAADLTNPGADLDGDGLSNDAERIFGLNPTSGSSANPISVPLNAAAGTFSYTRRDDALTGLDFEVWTSTNLSSWTKDAGAIQTAGTPDVNGVETVAVTLTATPVGGKLFARVRASTP